MWVSKGKNLLKLDENSSDDEIAELILGRSGTLRAPAIRTGSVFAVGYHEEGYNALFKS